MNKIDAFELWLESETGKACMRPLNATTDQTFLKNRLWWAFNAGYHPLKYPLTTEILELFKEIVEKRYVPAHIRKKIEHEIWIEKMKLKR